MIILPTSEIYLDTTEVREGRRYRVIFSVQYRTRIVPEGG